MSDSNTGVQGDAGDEGETIDIEELLDEAEEVVDTAADLIVASSWQENELVEAWFRRIGASAPKGTVDDRALLERAPSLLDDTTTLLEKAVAVIVQLVEMNDERMTELQIEGYVAALEDPAITPEGRVAMQTAKLGAEKVLARLRAEAAAARAAENAIDGKAPDGSDVPKS